LNDLSDVEVWTYGARTLTDFLPLSNYIYKGAGTEVPSNRSLFDMLPPNNLLVNPGFETGDKTGWADKGIDGSWQVQSTTKAYGTYAAQVTPDADKSFWIMAPDTMIRCYPGQRRTTCAFMKADANIKESSIRIFWYDAGGTYLGFAQETWYGSYNWTFRQITATQPITAYYMRVAFWFLSDSTPGNGYVDCCLAPNMGIHSELYDLLTDGLIKGTGTVLPSNKSLYDFLLIYGDIKVYPWAGTGVLDADPDYTYGTEKSEAGTSFVEVGHYDFAELAGDIESIFVNLVWAQKITGTGSGEVKWQIASGTNASPGSYVDITDAESVSLTPYGDYGRSGVVHKITNLTSTVPFTIRCLVRNVDATSAEAKIKSNSYIRVTYKRT